MSDENELFENNPFFMHCIEIRMLKTLKNPVEKFLFLYVFMLGNKSVDAADALSVHPTNVCRHLKKMKKRLEIYKKDYNTVI